MRHRWLTSFVVEDMDFLFILYIVNTMVINDLVTEGAMASAAMVLVPFALNIWFLHQKVHLFTCLTDWSPGKETVIFKTVFFKYISIVSIQYILKNVGL